MKTRIKQHGWMLPILAISCISFFSFLSPAGGDVVEIYLNDELLVRQYLYRDNEVKTVSLIKAKNGDQLKVYYGHCGVNGKNRSIILKDAQNRELKKWKYADVSGSAKSIMTCGMKDILALQKTNNTALGLFYASRELPGGKLLAKLEMANKTATVLP